MPDHAVLVVEHAVPRLGRPGSSETEINYGVRKSTTSIKRAKKPQKVGNEVDKNGTASGMKSFTSINRLSAPCPSRTDLVSRDRHNRRQEAEFGTKSSQNEDDGVSIVVTDTLHSRMRKVSILSMGDPVDPPRKREPKPSLRAGESSEIIDKVHHKNRTDDSARTSEIRSFYDPHHRSPEAELEECSLNQATGISMIVTETVPLRKVSMLSMGDPVDQRRKKDPKPMRTCESVNIEKAYINHSSVNGNNASENANEKESIERIVSRFGDEGHSNMPSNTSTEIIDPSVPPPPPLSTCKSTDFVFPATLLSEESACLQRIRSLDDDECLVEVEMQLHAKNNLGVEKSADVQMRFCSGDESNSSHDDLDETRHITRSGMEVRGVIVASPRQRQLMRQVSALGLEDPIFGTMCDQLNPLHGSNIFADMDFADVPEDMRDMLSLASDRTDVVEMDDFVEESPPAKSFESKGKAPLSTSPGSSMDVKNVPSTLLPTLGLDPRQTPITERSSASFGGNNRKPSKPPSHPNQHGRILKKAPSPLPTIPSNAENDSIQQFSLSPKSPTPQITPSAGSFKNKQTNKRNSHRTSTYNAGLPLHFDEVLAAQVDAMFQSSTNCLDMSVGNLNNSSISSLNDSVNSTSSKNAGTETRRNQRGNRPIPRREWSASYVPPGPSREGSTPRSTYKSTKNPSQSLGEATQRILPSVDSIFPFSGGADAEGQSGGRVSAPPTSYDRKWKSMGLSIGLRLVGGTAGHVNPVDADFQKTGSSRPVVQSKQPHKRPQMESSPLRKHTK
jgi:hypothetical protein